MEKTPMTITGHQQLTSELDRLKKIDRPRIIEAIAVARALGDLKENAEYHAAREQQSFVEGRIIEIESKLSTAQVIDISKITKDSKVVFGSTITLYNLLTNESVTYQIVGDDESDIKKGKISFTSPIAKALIGKREGDTVKIQIPAGFVEYEIEEVRYQ